MNEQFLQFLENADVERRAVFAASAERIGTIPNYIEKDFWVCLVLDCLYNQRSSGTPRLLFKGGTSLSKGFQLIERFSEDIDIVVFPEDLDFPQERNPNEHEIGNAERRRRVDELNGCCRDYVFGSLREELSDLLTQCEIENEGDDPANSTLLVQYPSVYPADSDAYVLPRVKVECGPISGLQPRQTETILPYIQEELGEEDFSVPNVLSLAPERSFLEKVFILHGWYCGHDTDENRLPEDRHQLSRHYYDVAMISETDTADRAVGDGEMFDQVRQFCSCFFRRAWMRPENADRATICLSPQPKLSKHLEADYERMRGMIHGEAPPFQKIIDSIKKLEERFNACVASTD